MKYIRYVVIASGLLMFACNSNKQPVEEVNSEEIVSDQVQVNSVVHQYDSLNAAVTYYWDTLQRMDDEKFECLTRLYDEMELMPKSNSFKIRKFKKRVGEVLNLRYDQLSMTDEQIDKYDAATDTLIFQTFRLANETQDFGNYPVAVEMLNLVKQYNGDQFVAYRGYYSEVARVRNEFVEAHKSELEANGVKSEALPTFFVY